MQPDQRISYIRKWDTLKIHSGLNKQSSKQNEDNDDGEASAAHHSTDKDSKSLSSNESLKATAQGASCSPDVPHSSS